MPGPQQNKANYSFAVHDEQLRSRLLTADEASAAAASADRVGLTDIRSRCVHECVVSAPVFTLVPEGGIGSQVAERTLLKTDALVHVNDHRTRRAADLDGTRHISFDHDVQLILHLPADSLTTTIGTDHQSGVSDHAVAPQVVVTEPDDDAVFIECDDGDTFGHPPANVFDVSRMDVVMLS